MLSGKKTKSLLWNQGMPGGKNNILIVIIIFDTKNYLHSLRDTVTVWTSYLNLYCFREQTKPLVPSVPSSATNDVTAWTLANSNCVPWITILSVLGVVEAVWPMKSLQCQLTSRISRWSTFGSPRRLSRRRRRRSRSWSLLSWRAVLVQSAPCVPSQVSPFEASELFLPL